MPVNIHGKEYLTVAERVDTFRSDYKPNTEASYGIVTELVSNDNEYVVMKASIVTETGFIVATGYAQEKYGDSNINKTSALENCETSAIGRALASFGLAGTEFASADEVTRAIEQQNQGVQYSPPQYTPSATKPASDKQKKYVRSLYEKRGGDPDMLMDYITNEGYDPNALSSKDASELIDKIEDM